MIMDGSVGRPSVPRHVLADLLDEQKRREARLAEEAAQKAADRQPVAVGVPALENAGPYESMMAAGHVTPAQEFGQWAKPRFLQDALEEGNGTRRRSEAVRRKEANEPLREREGDHYADRAVRPMSLVVPVSPPK
jgi:hypothetical protein